jgi:hypothetical protein
VSDNIIDDLIRRTKFKKVETIKTENKLVGNIKYIILEKQVIF